MADRETLELVAALADTASRKAAAAELAAWVGATALLVFVEDADVDALVPAPGFPQTLAGGPSWRRLLRACREPGIHRGAVAHPTQDESAPATACSGGGAVLVFVGGSCEEAQLAPLCTLLPLIGAALRAEQSTCSMRGELAVAREDARRAASLAQSLDAARAALERQASTLTEARRRAEEAMRAKDEFLAMLGHELRNPLAPIMTGLQIMRLKGSSSREQDIVERQVGQLMRLVDDLLDVSRIARGKIELRKQRVELSEVVTRAVEMASPLLEQKRQAVAVRVAERGLSIRADPDRLAQVFSNLLTNAAKYSDEETRIELVAERSGDRVLISVQDQGYGIAPHMLDAIFERFTQQQQSLDRSSGGLGLGLAIVKSLVALHGGTVRAHSEGRNQGSVFVVELPLGPDRAAAPTPTPPPETFAGEATSRIERTVRVLVVDDNRDAIELLAQALRSLGYIVDTAHDGPSALEVARAFRPHVAVLDIGLPVMDGYELARRLRDEHGQAALRLVALTGYGHASDERRSRDAGFDGHIVKPVRVAALQHALDSLVP